MIVRRALDSAEVVETIDLPGPPTLPRPLEISLAALVAPRPPRGAGTASPSAKADAARTYSISRLALKDLLEVFGSSGVATGQFDVSAVTLLHSQMRNDNQVRSVPVAAGHEGSLLEAIEELSLKGFDAGDCGVVGILASSGTEWVAYANELNASAASATGGRSGAALSYEGQDVHRRPIDWLAAQLSCPSGSEAQLRRFELDLGCASLASAWQWTAYPDPLQEARWRLDSRPGGTLLVVLCRHEYELVRVHGLAQVLTTARCAALGGDMQSAPAYSDALKTNVRFTLDARLDTSPKTADFASVLTSAVTAHTVLGRQRARISERRSTIRWRRSLHDRLLASFLGVGLEDPMVEHLGMPLVHYESQLDEVLDHLVELDGGVRRPPSPSSPPSGNVLSSPEVTRPGAPRSSSRSSLARSAQWVFSPLWRRSRHQPVARSVSSTVRSPSRSCFFWPPQRRDGCLPPSRSRSIVNVWTRPRRSAWLRARQRYKVRSS